MEQSRRMPTPPAESHGTRPAAQPGRAGFRVFAVGLALGVAVIAAEFLARGRVAQIQNSDRMDPGLIKYDPTLGWFLSSGWSGVHRHSDFTATYHTGADGFRLDPRAKPSDANRTWIVLGDSFTFGLGVGDDETFLSALNGHTSGQRTFINCAVPGYSTDQEVLLWERDLADRRPAGVVLAVYLGNDLLDNLLPFPVQVNRAKPLFGWSSGQLTEPVLPVNPATKPPELTGKTLADYIGLAPERNAGLKDRLRSASALASLILDPVEPLAGPDPGFPARFKPHLEVFASLVDRLRANLETRRIELRVVLLAGRSWVVRPEGASAAYQEFFRKETVALLASRGVRCVDAARALADDPRRAPDRWFFPHDGHLTAEGHRVVAELIRPGLE